MAAITSNDMKATQITHILSLAVGIATMAIHALPSHGQATLKSTVGKYFLIGVAVNDNQVAGRDSADAAIIKRHFNAVVAENCMKADAIHPEENRYDWDRADALVDFAEANGLVVTGHCLVWHSQVPQWMFVDERGNTVSRDTLVERMRRHIHSVVGRYRNRVRGWDVVNEAFEDDGSLRQTPYSRIIGPEYIEMAFEFAHEADPDAELYYNDYSLSLPAKRDAVCRLVRRLKAKGYRIDAVGMQSHCSLDYPSLDHYEAAIDSFAACGVKVMATELDVDVLPSPYGFGGADIGQGFEYSKRLDPYTSGLDSTAAQRLSDRYAELFAVFMRHRDTVSRVTLWGVSDGTSWLNNFPVRGRTNYPLLFDRHHRAKPAVERITEMFGE